MPRTHTDAPGADAWLLKSLTETPQTFFQLHMGLAKQHMVEDAYRYTDRWLQKNRKRGFLAFERKGRDAFWRVLP